MPLMGLEQRADEHEVIAFLGGGHMARALIGGLLRQGAQPTNLRVGEPRATAREELRGSFGVNAFADNAEALQGAHCVVLAVKPQDAAAALQGLRSGPAPHLLLSIAAGLPVARLQALCAAGTSVVRAMPNRPAQVGAGITGLYADPGLADDNRRRAEGIAAAAGRTVWVREERELDVLTALSGSGPAYFLLLAEELTRAATALGLSADTAALLASETLYGTGQLLHAVTDTERPSLQSLAAERAAVTSRGGTTEAALRVLQGGEFAALIARALQAAAARSAELGRALAG